MKKNTITPIGAIKKQDTYDCIQIRDVYKKGLLKLELFSHMLIFMYHEKRLQYKVLKIVEVDHKQGLIITETSGLKDYTYIYDIKAYMPCEDKVLTEDYKQESPVTYEDRPLYLNPLTIDANAEYSMDFIGDYRYHEGQKIFLNDDSLMDEISEGGHLRILWWFDKFDKPELRKTLHVNPPYENAPKSGVFATRSPVRPNLIASTLVKILSVDRSKNVIEISGFDGFDGTKIININPYEPLEENIRDYYLPAHLEHWPSYKRFDGAKQFSREDSLSSADSDIIMGMVKDPESIIQHTDEVQIPKKVDGYINIVKANENNLKNVSVMIPKNKMTVVTGVSGSGKSSLVFDTLYKSCQYQYVDVMGDGDSVITKPEVEGVTGLMPAVSISQSHVSRNPRSTVGTLTGISHQLRMLYTMIGTRHCPECLRPVKALPKDAIVQLIEKLDKDHDVAIRAYGDNDFESLASEDKQIIGCIDKGRGAIEVQLDSKQVFILQTKVYCYHCDRIFFDMTTSMFSPNNPEAMCPTCKGSGTILNPTEDRIAHDQSLSILDGASRLWGNLRKYRDKPSANWMKGQVLGLAEDMSVDLEKAYKDLPEDFKHLLMYGTGERPVSFHYNKGGRQGVITRPVEGAINIVKRLLENTTSSNIGMAKHFLENKPCDTCEGEKLVLESRLVTIDALRYPKALDMSVSSLGAWMMKLEQTLPAHVLEIVSVIIRSILKRLERLEDLGLAYLTMGRSAATLSGGEGQRVRLASVFNNELTNMLYILDEPTMGLHSKDYRSLIDQLKGLCENDNTVVVVEHKRDVMISADHIIDVGIGAGRYGGNIIASGSVDEIIACSQSLTGKNLTGEGPGLDPISYKTTEAESILLKGASSNNLKGLDVMFPKKGFTCVTGVSGSGKSTLVSDTLAAAILDKLGKDPVALAKYDDILGIDDIDDVINITQSPIGKTPRSTPATYTGVFDHIRDLFGKLEASHALGLKKEHFSFNGKTGACDTCGGMGRIQHKMGLMEDIWTKCQVCHGKRFKSDVLKVTYKGYTISDILEMEVSDALEVFSDHDKIAPYLELLVEVGLSYIKLGQAATTLSGGEAQRIKLAAGLSGKRRGNFLYILDEPTTGLHFEDINKLLNIIKKLSKSHAVIAIEHNPELIAAADYVIDMGPGGGDEGGYIIAKGSPYEVANNPNSYTGKVLLGE